jgi:L-histidine Nalpha-methyltransferase
VNPKPKSPRPHPELPASALYASPSLGRLWKKVHCSCSPFLKRPAVRRLYQTPAAILRKKLAPSYSLIALGCADGAKESLLFKKLPPPTFLIAADTNLTLARRATRRLPARHKRSFKIDLLKPLPPFHLPPSSIKLLTLFGVLPNLDPLPLLQRIAQRMKPGDLLLFSANLAPGKSAFAGARKILSQYDNPPTRRWLEAAIRRYRPKLPRGRLDFSVQPDPRQHSLARIEARWINGQRTWIVFSSRRPTVAQVEIWIAKAGLSKAARFLDPRGEEALWLVGRSAARR